MHFFRFENKNYFFIFLLFLHLCNRNSLAGLVNFFLFWKKKSYSYCFYIERNSLPGLLNIFTHFRFRIYILLSFYWTRKKFSCIMWASHFVWNGNKLSISSWLTTEVQVCRNVGRPNPRPPNHVFFMFLSLCLIIYYIQASGSSRLR